MEFVEKGYPFVLDADVSAGENDKGEYAIFVEIERNENLAENIKELTYGLSKLTGIDDWEFKYYKGNKTYEASSDNLREVVPLNKHSYNEAVNRVKTENIKSFFTKTLMDNLTLDGNLITIHKPFGVSVQLEMVSEDDPQSILETNEDTITVDHSSVGEVFWLTKVLGDYNIDKIGENFMFTNGDRAMLLKRV
jgi:hypothetical protein